MLTLAIVTSISVSLLSLILFQDIRDRARFYYCLLTNVSSKKVSKTMKKSNYNTAIHICLKAIF